jgi:hypothetical protein
MAGGVVYVDSSGKGFYDVGEGLGNVTLASSDGGSVVTWKSGAYAMDLKGQKEVTLTAFLDGEKFSKSFPAGSDNVKFDWIVPKEIVYRKADKYLSLLEGAKDPASAKYQQALVNLYVNTMGLLLDSDRKKTIADLTRDVGAALEAAEKAVLDAMAQDPAQQKKVIEEQSKSYHGTDAEAWFRDAELVGKLRRGVVNFQKQSSVQKPSPKEKQQLVAALEAEGAHLRTVQWKAELSGLVSKVKSIPGDKP